MNADLIFNMPLSAEREDVATINKHLLVSKQNTPFDPASDKILSLLST
jgi:hypothetical protein